MSEPVAELFTELGFKVDQGTLGAADNAEPVVDPIVVPDRVIIEWGQDWPADTVVALDGVIMFLADDRPEEQKPSETAVDNTIVVIADEDENDGAVDEGVFTFADGDEPDVSDPKQGFGDENDPFTGGRFANE